MALWGKISIHGVGLLGGSIGLALRQRKLAGHVVGVGRSRQRLKRAQQLGCVDEYTTDLGDAIDQSDLAVFCAPVRLIPDQVLAAADACGNPILMTDVGSTKKQIVEELDGQLPDHVQFIGSHPMAGSDRSGVEHSSGNLFEERLVIVTPTGRTTESGLEQIEKFWRRLGARVTRMSADDHDAAVAAVSHLPHVVAAALAAATPDKHLRIASTGWGDTTRVAAGNSDLWLQILQQNQSNTLMCLDNFAKVLDRFRDALAKDDAEKILELLEAGKQKRESVGN